MQTKATRSCTSIRMPFVTCFARRRAGSLQPKLHRRGSDQLIIGPDHCITRNFSHFLLTLGLNSFPGSQMVADNVCMPNCQYCSAESAQSLDITLGADPRVRTVGDCIGGSTPDSPSCTASSSLALAKSPARSASLKGLNNTADTWFHVCAPC